MSPRQWSLRVANSAVHGRGVFAGEDIPKGVLVLECRGRVVGPQDIVDGMRVMQIDDATYLAEDPLNPSADNFMNHSCNPNLGFVTGRPALHSLRDIGRGEELTFDYSTTMNEPDWRIPCLCVSSACREYVRSYCDLASAEQDRLRGIALSYLRERKGR